ncbi:CapA family protein [Hydrogenimonas sp. SS33]|uniref:CapA family protein n=1 Tax=Hydrogenimonas leucolamina TaxID=2954236 RepID=UPI00336BFD7A
MKKRTPGIGLHSSRDTGRFLQALHVEGALLANNHVTDFDIPISEQKRYLASYGIQSCGAADTLPEAEKPCFFEHRGRKVGILAFGWETISCIAATEDSKGVNPLRYDHIFDSVRNFQKLHPGTPLVTIFHWNYEYELYPQPAHRKLAFELIDLGVTAVYGHHPHIAGGAEIYRGKPVFYSLGNFYFPAGIYSGFRVEPPKEAYRGLCVEYADDAQETMLYWTRLHPDGKLTVESSEKMVRSERLALLSPFAGMSHEKYIGWFRKNRRKKKLLPIYKNPQSRLETRFNDLWVDTRQRAIDFLVRLRSKH